LASATANRPPIYVTSYLDTTQAVAKNQRKQKKYIWVLLEKPQEKEKKVAAESGLK